MFDNCINKVCTTPSKSCSNNCNENGVCTFISIDTGRKVDVCNSGNTQCRAVCSCISGYKGTTCDMTSEIFISNQKLRYTLIQGLRNMTKNQDPDLYSVVGWAASVVSLTQTFEELTNASISLIMEIVSTIIWQSSDLMLPYKQVGGMSYHEFCLFY